MDDEVGVHIGRKQGRFLPLDDLAFFLEDNTPPRSALTQGSVGDDGSVAAGGDTTFIRVQWLRDNAPYALEGRRYEEVTSLPFSTRQLTGDPTDLFSNPHEPPEGASSSKGDKYKQRIEDAKGARTTVVKCCLAKRVRDARVRDAIRDLVEFSSKTTHRTGLMLNWIALRALEDVVVKVKLTVRPNTGDVALDITENVLMPLPDFTDQTFIDRVMAANPESECPHVRRAVKELFHSFPSITVPPLSGQPLAQTTRQTVIGNIKTYVNYTYAYHQKRFLSAWCKERGLRKGAWWKIQKAINGWSRAVVEEEDVNDDAEALTDKARALIRSERALLGLRGDDKSTDTFRKAQHRFVITAYARWAAYLKARDLKSFTVLPHGRIRAKHIDIDTKTLFGIVYNLYGARKGVTQDEAYKSFVYLRDDHWNSVFRLDGLRNSRDARVERVQGLPPEERASNFNFGYMLTTDAEDACFHFKRPKTEREQEQDEARSKQGKLAAAAAKKRETAQRKAMVKEGIKVPLRDGPLARAVMDGQVRRIIGVDPGRTNIMVTAEMVDGVLRTFRLTRAQYKVDTGMKALVRKANLRNLRVRSAQAYLDEISLKTTETDVIARHVARLSWVDSEGRSVYDSLWDEKLRPCHARDRFGVWSRRYKVLDAFFDKVSGGDKDVLWAYGDASFAPSGKGSETVPVKASAKRCVTKHGQDAVGATPEFRTSIACCGCHTRLHDVKRELSEEEYAAALEKAREKSEKTGKRMRRPNRKVFVRGLKRCSNTACENFGLMDRDVNSAKLIRACGVGPRPPCLERESALPGAKKVILIKRAANKRVVPKGQGVKPMHHLEVRMFGPA
jgi:hypothetical protein